MTNKEIQNIILLELIAPDSGKEQLLSKEEADEVHKRSMIEKSKKWEYVFENISNKNRKNKLISLFNTLNSETE